VVSDEESGEKRSGCRVLIGLWAEDAVVAAPAGVREEEGRERPSLPLLYRNAVLGNRDIRESVHVSMVGRSVSLLVFDGRRYQHLLIVIGAAVVVGGTAVAVEGEGHAAVGAVTCMCVFVVKEERNKSAITIRYIPVSLETEFHWTECISVVATSVSLLVSDGTRMPARRDIDKVLESKGQTHQRFTLHRQWPSHFPIFTTE
jgi:hypothetical protein